MAKAFEGMDNSPPLHNYGLLCSGMGVSVFESLSASQGVGGIQDILTPRDYPDFLSGIFKKIGFDDIVCFFLGPYRVTFGFQHIDSRTRTHHSCNLCKTLRIKRNY